MQTYMPVKIKSLRGLPAFSLLESLVAVTILSIAGTATFMTFEWMLSSNRMPLEVQANAVLRIAAIETQKNNRYIDETLELNGWKIMRKVQTMPPLENCFMLQFYAMDEQGKTISFYEEIVCTD